MSMSALILGTIDHLRSAAGLGLSADECDEQGEGQPPPLAGQLYYAVHDEGQTNEATEYLDELFSIAITITLRTPWTPKDRENETVRPALRRMAQELRAAVHGQKEPCVYANARLGLIPATENGFIEPLRYASTSKVEPRGPDWFWAEMDEDGETESGASITVRFNRARRVQGIDDT